MYCNFCCFSFQGQTDLSDGKPSNLRSAIEEAFLVENGFNEMLMVEINAAAGNFEYFQSLTRGVFEASDSIQDQECNSLNRASPSLAMANIEICGYMGKYLVHAIQCLMPSSLNIQCRSFFTCFQSQFGFNMFFIWTTLVWLKTAPSNV